MIFSKKNFYFQRRSVLVICFTLLWMAGAVRLEAVVEENAEKLDAFKEEDLKEFQKKLTREEIQKQALDAEQSNQAMNNLGKAAQTAGAQGDMLTKEQIAELRAKLLGIQKKDRFRFGLDGNYTYNSNNNGAVPRHEKPEHQFNTTGNTQINFSGKKTDLGLELRGSKNWNIYNAINDSWQGEERLRTRRKFFKRLNVSGNSRIARNASKTLEISSNKIRWDAANQMSINYAFSRKLSMNLDLSSQKRLFLQEAFDQDSGWQVGAAPSGFWNITPKSRFSFGYDYGANRNRLKAGNSDSRGLNLGYFGQVTRKSSASVNVALTRQYSFKAASRSTTMTLGSGYIWQTTAKVQTSIQVTRGFSNTTSESVTGDVSNTAVVTKSDNYAVNDNFSLSLNYRMAARASLSLTGGIANTQTYAYTNGGENGVTHIMTFPSSLGINMPLTKWLTTSVQYSFSYKVGNEKTDTSRVHTLTSSISLSF